MSKTIPVIAIVANHNYPAGRFWLPAAYSRFVEAAGGLPVILPYLTNEARGAVWGRVHGLILAGGGDIAPFHYGEEPRPGLGEVDPFRDEMELFLAREALRLNRPLLGICRGMQLINVAAGGTILQDLTGDNYLQHQQKSPRCCFSHIAAVLPGTYLAGLLGEGLLAVNSFHHQAVRQLAPTLRKAAEASDGILEALESPVHRFVLGVQWHPETLSHPASRAIFKALIASACGADSRAV